MKISKLGVFIVCAVVFLTFGLSTALAQGTIKIGTVQPLTGGGALFGLATKNGIAMGLEDFNAKGGVNGKKIELIVYDSTTKPPVAATLAQRLIYEDKVPLILGSGSSLDNLAMMEVTEPKKFPLFIPSAGSPKITELGYKWVWRLSLTDKVTATILGESVQKKPEWKRVAFLNENTDYGRPPILILSKIVEGTKGKKIVALETYNKGDTDLSAQLMKIKKANPDVVFTWGYYTEGALIARQAQQIGLKAQLVGNQSLGFPEYIKLAGGAAEGVMFVDSTSGAYNPDPKIVALKERYEKQYKASFYNSVTDGYDGANVIGTIFKKVGTDPEKVQKALNTWTFEGAVGKIKFDAKGQARKGVLLLKVQDGRWVLQEKFL